MSKKQEIIRVPTERPGVILKTVTALDDEAWLLIKRPYTYPAPPSNPMAPDHYNYVKLRSIHEREAPHKINMGIWDIKRFGAIAFAGYVELRPEDTDEKSAKVGCIIADRYQRYGYASTSLRAIMKYGHENLGIDTYLAEVMEGNYPSQQMVEFLGFELVEQRSKKLIYALQQPTDKPVV